MKVLAGLDFLGKSRKCLLSDIPTTVLKVIGCPRYNTKCRGKRDTIHEIFRVVSRFPLHLVLYLGNLDYF